MQRPFDPPTMPVLARTPAVASASAHDCLELLDEVRHDAGHGVAPQDGECEAEDGEWLVLDEGAGDRETAAADGGDARAVLAPAAADPALPPAPLPPAPGTSFTWPALLFEVALGYAVLCAVAVQLGSGGFGWPLANPHPYLFLVLLMAAGRGLVAGLVAAAVGSALHLFALAVGGDVDGPWAWFDYAVMREPLVWHAVAFLVGHPRDLLLQRCRVLQQRQSRHEQDRERAERRIQRLFVANQRLKARVLDHAGQFGNLIDTARRIEGAQGGELFEIALDMVVEHCGASRCSVLAVRGDVVELAASRGWPAAMTAAELDAVRQSPFVQAAIAGGVRSNGFDPAQVPGERGPLIVAPLRDAQGAVAAVVCLEELPAERFSADVASTLFGIAEWTEVSWQRLARGERPLDGKTTLGDLLRPRPWLFAWQELPARLRREDARSERLGVPSAVLVIRATLVPGFDDAARRRLDEFLVAALQNGLLRESDSLYRGDAPGCYAVVLPATAGGAVDGVRRRVSRRLNLERCTGVFLFDLATFTPDAVHGSLTAQWPRIVAHCGGKAATARVDGPAGGGGAGDAQALSRDLRIELHLAIRHGTELYLVLWSLDSGAQPRQHGRDQRIEQAIAGQLSPADASYRMSTGSVLLLLPWRSGAEAFQCAAAVTAALQAALGPGEAVPAARVYALGNDLVESERLLDRLLARQLGHAGATREAVR